MRNIHGSRGFIEPHRSEYRFGAITKQTNTMKQTIIIKSLLIAGVTLLGLAATSRAQDPVPATGKM